MSRPPEPAPRGTPSATRLWAAGTAILLLALYCWTLAPSISELHDNLDSAELVVVASVSGVAHPPGAAIWLPLGRGALEAFVFLDEPAARTNLLSALCMATAGGVLVLATPRWRPGMPGWAAALAGVLAGVAPIPWAQGIVTEVLALQALLTALALWLAPDAAEGRRWPAFALVLGLMAWNHPTGLAVAIPLAVACAWSMRPPRKAWPPTLAAFLLPGVFSVAYLWLRAGASIAWGDTGSVGGIWDHLSGRIYQDVIDLGGAPSSIPETLRRALRQLPPPAWLFVIPGAMAIAHTRPRLATALAASCAILVVFVSAYRATGRQDYLTPVVFIAAMLAAHGAAETWDWLRGRLDGRSVLRPIALVTAVAIIAIVGGWTWLNGDEVSRRGDTQIRDTAVALLRAAPPEAHLETSDDGDTFALWYAQVVLGERPDVTIEDTRGLAPVLGPGGEQATR